MICHYLVTVLLMTEGRVESRKLDLHKPPYTPPMPNSLLGLDRRETIRNLDAELEMVKVWCLDERGVRVEGAAHKWRPTEDGSRRRVLERRITNART